jgi:hypothetical protein
LSRLRTDAWLAKGRLTMSDPNGDPIELDGGSLDGAEPLSGPCPRERADELSAVRSWVVRHRPAIRDATEPPAEPIEGGATLARILGVLRSVRG